MLFSTLTLTLILSSLSLAQSDGPAVDPNYNCPQATLDQITTCLGTVYSDEVTQAGGACSSSDTEANWRCICNLQFGLTEMGCYAPCPGSTSAEDQQYFDQNCKGQHFGVSPSSYSGSPLTTTAPNGQTGSSGTGPASTSSVPSTLSMPTSSNSVSSSSTTSISQSSSTSASSGAAAGDDNAGYSSVVESKRALSLVLTLITGVCMGAALL